jgi:lysophospholipase L1-like esterase
VKTLIIHCGTNDVQNGTPDEIISRFETLVKSIKNLNHLMKILISSILPRPLDDSTNAPKVILTNKILKAKCLEWEVCFIRSNSIMIKHGKPVTSYFQDGLHLSAQGVVRLKQFFSQMLTEKGNKASKSDTSSLYMRRCDWAKLLK